jgi:GNAT superfamily N-acetyltransferase
MIGIVKDSSEVPGIVRPASVRDVPALAAVLARAFARDPMVVWPIGLGNDLEARIHRHFELVNERFAAAGWMYRAGDGLGAMALLPPDSEGLEAAIGSEIRNEIAALSDDDGSRYERMWSWVSTCHPPERHWLLDQLAVDPAAQGRGIGGTMLRFAISRAEDDGLPLFLETGVAGNVSLYEQFGFRVMGEGDAPGDGPHIWFLRWDPSACPGAAPG